VILYLVRHGETAANRDGLGLGRADIPLTATGEQQAAAIAHRFAGEPLDRILSSPLERCRTTARYLAGERGLEVEHRDELLELDVGHTEGITFPAMREQFRDFLAAWSGPDGHRMPMPGGESVEDVHRRLAPLLDELRVADHARVALVTHNFVIRIALCHLLGAGLDRFRSFTVDLASVTTVNIREGRAVIRSLNDSCHLSGLESSDSPA
jgi:broad specificity phosphatase PhoE